MTFEPSRVAAAFLLARYSIIEKCFHNFAQSRFSRLNMQRLDLLCFYISPSHDEARCVTASEPSRSR